MCGWWQRISYTIICVSLCVFFVILQGNGKNFQTFYDGRCVNVGNLITGNANGLKKITKIGVSSCRDLETPWEKLVIIGTSYDDRSLETVASH